MALVCQICKKRVAHGHSKQHRRGVAGKRWKKRVNPTPRLFKPNLQVKTLIINGKKSKLRICTKCLKRIKKFGSIKGYSKISLA